jgi:hypothetical protein
MFGYTHKHTKEQTLTILSMHSIVCTVLHRFIYKHPHECVYAALLIQHAKHICHIVICGLSGSTIFFHIISYMARFSKKVFEHKMCFFLFSVQLLSEKIRILRRNERDINLHTFHVKYLLFLSDFNETWIFLTDFRKILKYQISWKSI